MLTNCFKCSQTLSEKARFCSNCATQVRCKYCSEDLVNGATFCEMCGEDVVKRQTQAMNNFKYTDGKKEIAIEASFTNEVGESAATIFAMIRGGQAPMRISNPMKGSVRLPKGILGQEELFTKAEVVDDDKETNPPAPAGKADATTFLRSLFEQNEEGWMLVNPILKSKNKADFVKRLTCLFLQFNQDRGTKPVPRADVIKLLQDCSAYDANARTWFREEKTLIRTTAKDFTLILPGTQYVTEVLQEIQDDDVPNLWKVGTVSKTGRKSSTKKDRKKTEVEEPESE